ncbi:MAG: TetR/AcrR family transcriptional regulator [Fimbriimonas sp.]|nr:TetR/AcrR family transcriptional regulator [Fimbriimonas sp.]
MNPAKTREDILNAAFVEFAAHGYEGASIAEIAKSAGVTKSLVQYHFGAKEELWSACIAEHVTPLLDAVDRFLETDQGDPADLIAARFAFLKQNPQIRRLLFWAGMGSVPIPAFIEERRDRVLGKLNARPNSPIASRFLAALAATDGWFLFRSFYEGPFGGMVFDEATEKRILEVLMEMVRIP